MHNFLNYTKKRGKPSFFMNERKKKNIYTVMWRANETLTWKWPKDYPGSRSRKRLLADNRRKIEDMGSVAHRVTPWMGHSIMRGPPRRNTWNSDSFTTARKRRRYTFHANMPALLRISRLDHLFETRTQYGWEIAFILFRGLARFNLRKCQLSSDGSEVVVKLFEIWIEICLFVLWLFCSCFFF